MVKGSTTIKKYFLNMAKQLPSQFTEDGLALVLINRAVADAHEDETLRQLMVEHYGKYATYLEECIRQGIKNKEFKKSIDPRKAAWQLMGPGLAFSATQGLKIDPKLKAQALQASITSLLDSWSTP